MNNYIAFEEGVIDNATELVGDRVEIHLQTLRISLIPEGSTERVYIPLDAVKRVELEETPTVWDSEGKP